MAHSLSAKKRIRQNEKRRARNRNRKLEIKDQTRVLSTAMTAGDLVAADKELKVLVKHLDRAAVKNTIHKKAASRKRSRLTKRLNAANKAVKAGVTTTITTAKKKKKA